ncbi:MAG: glycosyltransferase family 4 protein [Anaerolineae bacterium]|nr:glycosyltransferase family 4 protein [Anaerolineae bacterium]
MHIGLNAHLLSSSSSYRAAGINWYIYNLLQHLPKAAGHHSLTAFLGDKEAAQAFSGLRTEVSALSTAKPVVRILWEQLVQPVRLLRRSIDLLHSLAFVQPLVMPCRGVVTIYDLSFLLFPQGLQTWRRLYLRWGTARSAQAAERVIAISASTRRDLVALLNVPEDKVDVVPCGVDEDFQPIQNRELLDELRARRGLPQHMLLSVGTIEPRKNLVTLLRSYALLRDRIQAPPLAIAGPQGWRYEEVSTAVRDLGLEEDVLFTGYVPREELPLWYNAADLFVYPSLYEGFGLPPLEAMACGTPVVTSNISSLPEVVGEAGLLVEPTDVEGMAEALYQGLTDRSLREELRGKGLQKAATFTWSRVAAETVAVYDRALARAAS